MHLQPNAACFLRHVPEQAGSMLACRQSLCARRLGGRHLLRLHGWEQQHLDSDRGCECLRQETGVLMHRCITLMRNGICTGASLDSEACTYGHGWNSGSCRHRGLDTDIMSLFRLKGIADALECWRQYGCSLQVTAWRIRVTRRVTCVSGSAGDWVHTGQAS